MDDMFRPPTNRAMRALDRSFFRKTIPLSAARVLENKDIARCRKSLEHSKDALRQERIGAVHPDPDSRLAEQGNKCILLRPSSVQNGMTSMEFGTGNHELNPQTSSEAYSPTLARLVEDQVISVVPYDLQLDYSYWTYHDIMSAILPEDEQGEIPSGFSQVGHVAHLNLREAYLPYKHLVAEILMDKNPSVRTVINKIDDVGEESEFRTFKYEGLAGPDDLEVTISEENCVFKFDYAKVYWNSRLNTEHRRLVSMFKEGEAVCDVMAGIGPFAVPAGKKNIFVWANDLNPDSYAALQDAVKRNKVQQYVQPFNEDGHSFIKSATESLLQGPSHSVDVLKKTTKKAGAKAAHEVARSLTQPRVFNHFVMNLPATAVTFLPSFIGLYPPNLRALLPADAEMPLIHCYCFNTKSDDNLEEGVKICEQISDQLQYEVRPGTVEEGGVEIFDVRDVAPKKRMFCASFRLPQDVAFRTSHAQ